MRVGSIPVTNIVKVNGIIRSIYEYLGCIILANTHTHTHTDILYIFFIKRVETQLYFYALQRRLPAVTF